MASMSTVKAISYDLHDPGQDYDDLHEAIKDYGLWWHHLESTWLVKTSSSCKEIRDDLKNHLDSNDELLVTKLSGAWTSGISDDGTDWLYEQM